MVLSSGSGAVTLNSFSTGSGTKLPPVQPYYYIRVGNTVTVGFVIRFSSATSNAQGQWLLTIDLLGLPLSFPGISGIGPGCCNGFSTTGGVTTNATVQMQYSGGGPNRLQLVVQSATFGQINNVLLDFQGTVTYT